MTSADTPATPARVGPGPGEGVRAVAIGGGHGLNRCLRALTHVADEVTAIITAADDGGSSGRLRRDLGVVPPGDLRMALAALSPRDDLVELLQYRFDAGELDGHSLGNLIIVAASALADGDLVAALDRVGRVLECRGRVVPCTLEPLKLHARVDGDDVEGQVVVARSRRVERVWVDPDRPTATPAALSAIDAADVVVLGPGSLYTSVIPNLLVPGIADAVRDAEATTVFVANLREQRGETEGMTLHEHLDALRDHVTDLVPDVVIAHRGGEPSGGGSALHVDAAELGRRCGHTLIGDLLDGEDGHDPVRLASLLREALARGRGTTAP